MVQTTPRSTPQSILYALLGGLALALCFGTALSAETSSLDLVAGVAPHAGIDALYAKFSEAYRTLDAEMVSDLYAEDAFYLVPGKEVIRGRRAIREDFEGFFGQVQERGQKMEISFEILNRTVDGAEGQERGYDIGIFTLRFESRDASGAVRKATNQGKFIIISQCEAARCRFAVDGFSALPPRDEIPVLPES